MDGTEIAELMSVVQPGMLGLKLTAALASVAGLASTLALVVPAAVERLMPPAVQDELWTYLPFERIRSDLKTVECKDGLWLRMYEMGGADITLASDERKEQLYKARKYAVDELERYGVHQFKMFHVKERMRLERTLHAAQPVVRQVGDMWESTFPTPYRLRHFVMIVVKGKTFEEACGLLDPAENFIVAAFGDYDCRVMVEPDADALAGDDLRVRAGPLEALARVVSPVSQPNPVGRGWSGPLSSLVTGDEIDFTRTGKTGTIVFTSGSERKYASIVTYREAGEKTTEAVMREVLAIDCPMVVYHAVRPIPNAIAVVKLNQERAASLGMHLSFNAKGQYDEVLRQVEGQVADERASLVYYVMHVMVLADSEKELKQIYARLTAVMTRTAGTAVRLGPSAQPTFMSMVSFDSLWPRQFRFLSTNVATMLYPQRSESGMSRSDWADEPLAWFRTVSGDPYPFSWHSHGGRNAPAHTLLIGPTGSGKAQPDHATVMSTRGALPMGRVARGDMVYAEDGRAYPVTGVFPQGVKRRFRVVFSDGRATECCDEHLWDVSVDGAPWRTARLSEVMAWAAADPARPIRVPLCAPVERPAAVFAVAPRTMGRVAAAGGVLPAPASAFAGAVDGDDDARGPWGVDGRVDEIPADYLVASVSQRRALLDGLMDVGGCGAADGGRRFATTSAVIAGQAVGLVRSLGGTARLGRGDDGGFVVDLDLGRGRTSRDDACPSGGLAFESFEELSPCPMTCISIGSPRSLYLTDDHVVTHNTSLMTFLAGQSMRVRNLRVFLMDRLNGMKIFTVAAGGRYLAFNGDERNASLNPLHQPDTPENRTFLRLWLKMLTGCEGPEADDEIGRAVKLVYSPGQSKGTRKLTAIQRAAFGATSDVRMALTPWVNPDAYGSYFNADEDTLDLESTRLAGFNMTDILNDPKLAPVVMHYLVHRFRDLSIRTTDPTLVIVDETAPMLQNEMFRNFLKSGLQEGRKLRQAYVLCFQTPKSLYETGMSQVVLDQSGLLIFFRNTRDSEDARSQYANFGLNESEIDFIVGRTFKEKRYAVLMKRPNANDSAIVDVDLSRLGQLMGVFESDARQVAALDGFLAAGHTPAAATQLYINSRR